MPAGPPLYMYTVGIDDLPDYWTPVGGIFTKVASTAVVTRVPLIITTDYNEGDIMSVHTEDDSTSYQNTSGNPAYATVTIVNAPTGVATRHVRIWSSPNDDSIAGATLRYEVGSTDHIGFDEQGESLSFPDVKIENNHYLVVENVDDGRTGTNDFTVGNAEFFFILEYTGLV